ncbi:MAG: hypothetical protein KKA12_09405 [Alphaproteobacteria bacterium]|nr:hypothetical protein [Alphaproteobacteria bacterium]
MPEDAALGASPDATPATDQCRVSALGWGLALAGGTLLWAGLIAALWR